MSVYQPRGTLRRITPNGANRRFIKGGKVKPAVGPGPHALLALGLILAASQRPPEPPADEPAPAPAPAKAKR